MTDRFTVTAKLVGQLNGLPDYPFAVIDHPIANNDDAMLRDKARAAVAQIVPMLTRRAA